MPFVVNDNVTSISDDCFYSVVSVASTILDSMLDAIPDSTPQYFSSEPKVSLSVWIKRLLSKSQSTLECAFLALFYLNKLQKSFPHLRFTEVNVRRLYLVAFMLAFKYLEDENYTNSSWSIIGFSHYSTDVLNAMESEMLSLLDWNLFVSTESLQQFLSPFAASITI
ncbi:hypothetical protein GEMRC1_000866 [Eukaryota sp. GEM-RC1]